MPCNMLAACSTVGFVLREDAGFSWLKQNDFGWLECHPGLACSSYRDYRYAARISISEIQNNSSNTVSSICSLRDCYSYRARILAVVIQKGAIAPSYRNQSVFRSMIFLPASSNGPVSSTSSAWSLALESFGMGPHSAVKLPHITPNLPSARTFPSESRMR